MIPGAPRWSNVQAWRRAVSLGGGASSRANRSAAFAPSEWSIPTTITFVSFSFWLLVRVHVLERVLGIRVGPGLGELERRVDDFLCLGVEP
jgi:hypothetical protein